MDPRIEAHFETKELELIAPKQKTSLTKKILNLLLFVIVIGVGIWFIFKFTGEFNTSGNMKDLSQTFSEMNIWLFVLACGLLAFYILTDGLKYLVISKTATGRGNIWTSLKTAIMGKFYDNITPSSTGGQPMQIAYMIKKGYKPGEATAVSITRFFVQMFAWSIIGAILMIAGNYSLQYIEDVALRNTLQVFAWVGFGMILFLPLFTLSFVIFPKFTKTVLYGVIRLGKKMHIVKDEEKLRGKAQSTADDFVSSVRLMCTKPFNFFILIVLCLLEPLITISLPYVLLIAFNNGTFDFQMYFTAMALYMYAHNSAATIFTPGNGGAFELTLSIALSGISKNVSTWVIFFFRVLTFYVNITIGMIMLLYEFIRNIVKKQKNKSRMKALILGRAALPEPEVKKSVAVLLSTYNGAKYVRYQLDSLEKQYGIEMNLIVRDDGSKDGTVDILREYEAKGVIKKLIVGENVGFQKSFHKLLEAAPKSDYYAFADQDDVWDADKVLNGVRKIEQEEDQTIPLVYWCAFRSIDKNGKVYKAYSQRSPFDPEVDPLVLNINTNDIRGCTAVFNQVAYDMLLSMGLDGYRYHDWMIQLIGCVFGKEIYDRFPHISYRCHNDNCFGPAKFSLASFKRGLKFLKTIEFQNNHSKTAIEFYNAFGKDIKNEKQKEILELIVNYRTDKKAKKTLLKNKEFWQYMPLILRMLYRYEIRHNKY